MSNYFNLTKDTTGPNGVTVSLNDEAQYATSQLITATISTTDVDQTNYQMLIWGDVDETENVNIQADEGDSSWISFSTSQQVKLSTGDAEKNIYLKVRDDVHNVSSQDSDSIILDTTLPVVNISTGPDVSKISKQPTKNVCAFSFTVNSIFDEYKVKVVASTGAAHDTGTQIPTTSSTNMSGSAGDYPSATPINCQIYCTDLETADAADGQKIIKVFAKDKAENWSV